MLEFQRAVLDSLRQPLEAGVVSVARANAHVTFPARVQLVAAMNPCRCGHLGDPALACSRAPRAGSRWMIRRPRVRMIRHPPDQVPREIAVAAARMTQIGRSSPAPT